MLKGVALFHNVYNSPSLPRYPDGILRTVTSGIHQAFFERIGPILQRKS
jgi:hypothetical protein